MSVHRRLETLRATCRETLAQWDDDACRAQHHPLLSPLSWHVGHVFFVETYWLQEVVCGRDRRTRPWHDLFFPEFSPKHERSRRLPQRDALLVWTAELAAENNRLWAEVRPQAHELLRDGYLAGFLVQHYAQHLETMGLIRRQARLAGSALPAPAVLRTAAPPPEPAIELPAAEITVGGAHTVAAYDNELPAHRVRVGPVRLAARPVTNAQWLAFMQADGYRRPDLWREPGRTWLARTGAGHPEHWRSHAGGGWYSADPREPLDPEAPVHGIGAHEAEAYAHWAQARLPHEHEWEHAAQRGLLPATGRVWEWCGNPLYPYPGFVAYPYRGYSTPWFDGSHRVLRGASWLTDRAVRRPGFRNFYPEGHRHVLAGLRLAWGGTAGAGG